MKQENKKKNLSNVEIPLLDKLEELKIGIVVSKWNEEITSKLYDGCIQKLLSSGIAETNIRTIYVPGAYELPFGAKLLISDYSPNAIICIGCVIKGETAHNEYINHSVAQGIVQLSLFANKPIIYGVLTPNTMEQAKERAGGAHGNKGVEAAATALQMIHIQLSMNEKKKQIGFG